MSDSTSIAVTVIVVVLFITWVILWILAIRSSSMHRYTREIPGVEMITAFNNPIMYWILRLFGVLGRLKEERSKKICHTA